jgi:hypothetical protein
MLLSPMSQPAAWPDSSIGLTRNRATLPESEQQQTANGTGWQRWGLSVRGVGDYGESMAAGRGGMDSQPDALYAQAQAARGQSKDLAVRNQAVQRDIAEILGRIHAARDRAERVHELWLAAHPGADRLRYSAHARLQARLASMPVIEQAKGIIMAQLGWTDDQAFDALRRASQRDNIKVRDLAAQIVATTAQSASAQPYSRARRPPGVRHARQAASRDPRCVP